MKIVGKVQGKSILLLQGPMGTFFRDLKRFFTAHGATVYTICFNMGDYLFADSHNRIIFKAGKNEWQGFITNLYDSKRIDKIFLFGNCRFYHKIAISVAKEHGIEVFVFEEGYIRPNFITLERDGVNGDSLLPRIPEFYKTYPASQLENSPEEAVNNNYMRRGFYATAYYLSMYFFRFAFPHYEHHRDPSPYKEALYGVRNMYRKYLYSIKEKHIPALLSHQFKKQFYFVPLQTGTDFQLTEYSPYSDIGSFIKKVLTSFSRHAPQDKFIAFKHHPMERGMSTYTSHIQSVARKLGILERVLIFFDVHLPTCLKNAIGTITINSTVGISSLFHGTPTITLGTAIYDIHGLTCKDMDLDQFWTEHSSPDRDLFHRYRKYLISETQLNGGFYGKFPF